jgi:hypothetical protein
MDSIKEHCLPAFYTTPPDFRSLSYPHQCSIVAVPRSQSSMVCGGRADPQRPRRPNAFPPHFQSPNATYLANRSELHLWGFAHLSPPPRPMRHCPRLSTQAAVATVAGRKGRVRDGRIPAARSKHASPLAPRSGSAPSRCREEDNRCGIASSRPGPSVRHRKVFGEKGRAGARW